jgi:glycosyltransferase involved in cell wall biosynthesis
MWLSADTTDPRSPLIRVLFDAHQLGRQQTGNETYVREVLGRLGQEPDLEIVAGVEAGESASDRLGAEIRKRRVPRQGLLRLAALTLLARQEQVDVVHAIYFAPPATGRRSVVTIHDISFEKYPEFFSRGALVRDKLLIRASVRSATRVITVSETSKRDIVETYDVSPDRVVAIPNGVSPLYNAAPTWRAFEGDRPFRILAVGSLEPRKNLTRLVDAVASLTSELRVELRVVGPDGYKAELIRQRLGGVAEATVSGWLAEDELAEEYRRADVFAYPSLYEGFGLPILEAMASGTPVVASNRGAIPEVAGDAAILVDPLDVDALSGALRQVALEQSVARRLRERGLERAKQFTWERSASAHAEVYRGLTQ